MKEKLLKADLRESTGAESRNRERKEEKTERKKLICGMVLHFTAEVSV